MVMTLNLEHWETVSLTAGCNLYAPQFRLCVLTVRATDQQQQLTFGQEAAMYFRERDKPVVPAETFLATAVPKLLMGALIVFLNVVAMVTIIRGNRSSAIAQLSRAGVVLPQSTQGLLHSLFATYLLLGLLTLYSQVSLSTFLLGDFRLVDDQGLECLAVNSALIGLSLSVALHLVSLGVDRTLAAVLPHQRYAALGKGTVPLWLLSIWLPAGIMGALPLAGWKTPFSFCVFLLQFNDDYLRFVAGFFLTCLVLIPLLFLFLKTFLRRRQTEPRILLYRWHRKLQAHHRLTFALVLAVNTVCWAPFHIYLLLACQTCPYSALGSGFTMEYLFILALVPALLIPLMFSLRSSFVDDCGRRMTRCVRFRGESAPPHPPWPKSPLFFIDDLQSSSAASSASSGRTNKRDGTGGGSFFVPHYLPSTSNHSTLDDKKKTTTTTTTTTTMSRSNRIKASFRSKYDSYTNNRTLPLKNFCAYLNNNNNNNGEIKGDDVYDSLGSDCKYGFPIIPTHGESEGRGKRNNQ